MYNSHFQAKCGRTIMWSHKIQSLWSDLKNHINMTGVTAGSGFIVHGLFLWIIKWNSRKDLRWSWRCLSDRPMICHCPVCYYNPLFVSIYVCVKWLFLCLSGWISAMQEININGPSSCLSLGPLTSSLNHVQSAEGKQDCRERAGAVLRSRPSRVTDVVVRSRSFFAG